jgi:hypothetical protein
VLDIFPLIELTVPRLKVKETHLASFGSSLSYIFATQGISFKKGGDYDILDTFM